MLWFIQHHFHTTIYPFSEGILEDKRFGVVYPSTGVYHDGFYIRTPNGPYSIKEVSIVICTYGRPESLNDTLESLTKQTFKDFEVILITEKGDLSSLRDEGLKASVGDITCFLDDDVYCPSTWLQAVINTFKQKGVVGVSGPTTVTEDYRANRDIFKFKIWKRAYDFMFLDGQANTPGFLSRCGAPSTASNNDGCSYEGEAGYLEACNMSVKREAALNVGGFDPIYIRTSEWCEVDLALKLKKKGILKFVHGCKLYHRPSKAGIYKARLSTNHRWKNFITFQKRWIKPSLTTYIYRGFVWAYLKMKEWRMI